MLLETLKLEMTEYVLTVRTQILYFCRKFAATMYFVLLENFENLHTIHQVKCTQIVLCTNLIHL